MRKIADVCADAVRKIADVCAQTVTGVIGARNSGAGTVERRTRGRPRQGREAIVDEAT